MMRRDHLNEVVANKTQWRRRVVRQRIVSIVSCLIVFCMTYALILPALANRDASAVTTSTVETTTVETPENVVSAIQTEPDEDWETIFANANLTGVWREDLLSIAQSQLGYIESARNFVIAEDGETTKGYTYYGDWYGDPYGDWDAMFVSFCLNFAGIEDMPLDANPQAMVDVLDVTDAEVEAAVADGNKVPTDYYYTVKEYNPIAGDLVFFDTTGDGLADRVGIVTDVSLDGTQVTTVEGDSNNKVQNNTYEASDATILGYGTLPAQPVTYTYTANGLTVKVSLPQGTTVPVDAVLSVTPIESNNEGYNVLAVQATEAVDGTIETLKLYDISFYTADDNTYIPVDDDAKVTITFGEPVAASESNDVVVLHYDDKDENPVVLVDTEIADQATKDAEVKFETEGFSIFAVVTVNHSGNESILDGQTFAIVPWNAEVAMSPSSQGDGLVGTGIGKNGSELAGNNTNVLGALNANIYWTFDAVPGGDGNEYYISTTVNGEKKYLDINAETGAALVNDPRPITVETYILNGTPNYDIVGLEIDGTYLEWKDQEGFTSENHEKVSESGFACFVLVKQLANDQDVTATVVSRANLRAYAMMPGAQIVIFVRQYDDQNNAHYYAVDANGSAKEITLEDGGTLAEGSVMIIDGNDISIRWDATGTPNSTENGGWNTSNNVNGPIDLLAKNLGQELFLTPNMDGGYGGANGEGTDGAKYHGVPSITSMIENTVNDARWYKNDSRNGLPVRANHNSSFRRITGNNDIGLDLDIASTIVSDLSYGDDDTKQTYVSCQIYFKGGTFVAGGSGGYTDDDDADDSIAFYVAVINDPNDKEVSADKNLVGQILTREEYQDAAAKYGADYPFMIIATDGTSYYALDANGVAQPVDFIKGNTLEAGGRFIFQTKKANKLPDESSYNANRILWDPSPTNSNKFALDESSIGWVELWMTNVATKQYLCPNANGLTAGVPLEGEFNPGFFIVNDFNGDQKIEIGSYLASRLGSVNDEDGKFLDEDTSKKYCVQLNAGKKQFEVVNGWSEADGGTLGAMDGNTNPELVFYVAMLVDWNVTVTGTTDDGKVVVQEYEVVPGVKENVKMYVFNYGSAIDLYGQYYNDTVINDEVRPGVSDLLDYGHDLIYRFFYRPGFGGEVIDGTNDPNGENTDTSGIGGNWNLYSDASDPTDVGNQRVFAETLIGGYPALKMPVNFNNNAGTVTTTKTVNGESYFSLGYLFDPIGFKSNTVSDNNKDYTNLVISDSSNNGDLHAIAGDNGTEVNATGGKTAPADLDDTVANNPNYAVRSYPVGNGTTTGLFQRDENGYYYYDSKVNAATYNESTNLFELYDYTIIPADYNNLAGGNFLPFNNGYQARRVVDEDNVTSGGDPILKTISKNDRMYQINGFQQDDDTTIGRGSMADLWVGMYMEIEFTMTEDGKVAVTQNITTEDGSKDLIKYTDDKNVYWYDETSKIVYDANGNRTTSANLDGLTQVRNDLIFDFAGDDDVLVYIDDVLVMDMNGIHGVWKGNINFRTGKVTNNQYPGADTNGKYIGELLRDATNTEEVVSYAEEGLGDTLAPNTAHTLKFYYLERGGNISDCAISFNLEAMPSGDLSLSKEVVGVDEGETYFGEYQFKLDIETLGDIVEVPGMPHRISYAIMDEAGNIVQVMNEKGELSDVYVICEDASALLIDDNNSQDSQDKYKKIIDAIEEVIITLQAHQTVYVTGLPEGTKLRVIELNEATGQPIESVTFTNQKGDSINHEDGSWSTGIITIDSDEPQNGQITAVNTLSDVDFTFAKDVYDSEGNKLDTSKEFSFTYTVTYPNGTTGTGTEKVTAGNSKTIKLPFGAVVNVTETKDSAAGYNTTYEVVTKIEAEAGADNTGEIRSENPTTHSGGEYVGSWDNGNSATYIFKSPVDGNATMKIYGCCDADDRKLVVTINGETLDVINTVGNGSWNETNGSVLATVTIPVIAGENTMTVGGPATDNAPNVDYFEIVYTGTGTQIPQYGTIANTTITFTNYVGYELPETGGTGTLFYTLGGLTLMAVPLMYGYRRKRVWKGGEMA